MVNPIKGSMPPNKILGVPPKATSLKKYDASKDEHLPWDNVDKPDISFIRARQSQILSPLFESDDMKGTKVTDVNSFKQKYDYIWDENYGRGPEEFLPLRFFIDLALLEMKDQLNIIQDLLTKIERKELPFFKSNNRMHLVLTLLELRIKEAQFGYIGTKAIQKNIENALEGFLKTDFFKEQNKPLNFDRLFDFNEFSWFSSLIFSLDKIMITPKMKESIGQLIEKIGEDTLRGLSLRTTLALWGMPYKKDSLVQLRLNFRATKKLMTPVRIVMMTKQEQRFDLSGRVYGTLETNPDGSLRTTRVALKLVQLKSGRFCVMRFNPDNKDQFILYPADYAYSKLTQSGQINSPYYASLEDAKKNKLTAGPVTLIVREKEEAVIKDNIVMGILTNYIKIIKSALRKGDKETANKYIDVYKFTLQYDISQIDWEKYASLNLDLQLYLFNGNIKRLSEKARKITFDKDKAIELIKKAINDKNMIVLFNILLQGRMLSLYIQDNQFADEKAKENLASFIELIDDIHKLVKMPLIINSFSEEEKTRFNTVSLQNEYDHDRYMRKEALSDFNGYTLNIVENLIGLSFQDNGFIDKQLKEKIDQFDSFTYLKLLKKLTDAELLQQYKDISVKRRNSDEVYMLTPKETAIHELVLELADIADLQYKVFNDPLFLREIELANIENYVQGYYATNNLEYVQRLDELVIDYFADLDQSLQGLENVKSRELFVLLAYYQIKEESAAAFLVLDELMKRSDRFSEEDEETDRLKETAFNMKFARFIKAPDMEVLSQLKDQAKVYYKELQTIPKDQLKDVAITWKKRHIKALYVLSEMGCWDNTLQPGDATVVKYYQLAKVIRNSIDIATLTAIDKDFLSKTFKKWPIN